jgi:hypothetical protein
MKPRLRILTCTVSQARDHETPSRRALLASHFAQPLAAYMFGRSGAPRRVSVERDMDSRPSASVESSVVIVPSQHTRAASCEVG